MSIASEEPSHLIDAPIESTLPFSRLTTSAAMRVALTHELSQPLSALATYIFAGRRLLSAKDLDRELLNETIENAETEMNRARDVLKKLRGFVTSEKPVRLPVNLLHTLQTEAAHFDNEARMRAVSIHVEPGWLPLVTADPIQIRQVLVNLLSNAIDAAAGARDGVVSVRCLYDLETIEIVVEDNGRGVPPEIAEHLFEPFQTTKVRGMGLGLPLSRQIIEAHRGRIWWERTVPQGTRFHVVLPLEAPARHET